MIISLTTSFPTFSFRALISPSLPDHTNLMLLKFLFKSHITKHLVDQLIDLFCFPLFHKQGTEFPFSNYLQI